MVQAEPNKTKLKFQLVKKWQSKDTAEKTEFQIFILPSDVQTDDRFIKPGETMEGFTFENLEKLQPGSVTFATGQYIGGPWHGKVQLTNFKSEYEEH